MARVAGLEKKDAPWHLRWFYGVMRKMFGKDFTPPKIQMHLPALVWGTEGVRATEIAFAKAFADRDAKKFFSYLADDAQFLGRRNTMHGKQEVIATWSEFFKSTVAPFHWQPERVVTNAAGDLGFSSGPVFDEAGAQIGAFTSTWIRQADGSWKILFDGGSACPTTNESAQ